MPVLQNPNTGKNASQIPHFSFVDQDNKIVTEQTITGKIVVADFIFLNCGTICPQMNAELLRVYKVFENNPDVVFLSHSIDPERDSVTALKQFAVQLGVKTDKWHFVTGNIDSIYSIAKNHYFNDVAVDSTQQGNFLHSAAFVLLDKQRRIRGVYDGTSAHETEKLISDITNLIN